MNKRVFRIVFIIAMAWFFVSGITDGELDVKDILTWLLGGGTISLIVAAGAGVLFRDKKKSIDKD